MNQEQEIASLYQSRATTTDLKKIFGSSVPDQPGDVGNPRPGTDKPGAGLPGRRFTIKVNRLQELLTELAKDFGKISRWELLCKEQNATSEAEQVRIAEQVLAEPTDGSVAAGYSHWARLHGAKPKPAPPYNPTGF